MRRSLSALVALVAGCGDSTDPGVDASPGCTRPDVAAADVRAYVAEVVMQLADTPRATAGERMSARTYLSDQLTMLGWQPELQSYATGANVIATIPATMGAEKLVVVGAHFDSVPDGPGANDNASGVAVVLAVARFLRDTPCRTAPVLVAFFDEEELGLLGSRAAATMLEPTAVRAVHTIDQVSWDQDGDRRFELEQPTPQLEAEWRAAAGIVGATVAVTSTGGTDHQSFRSRGFAAIGLTEEYVGGDTHPQYHLPGDTPLSASPYLDYLALAASLTGQVILEEVSP